MAIFYDYTITVKGNTSKLDKNIYLYRGNKNIDLYFTIKDAPFQFQGKDLIVSINAKRAVLKILKPNGEKVRFNNIPIENGRIKLSINSTFADEISEEGKYSFQIDLLDDADDVGIVSIPPVIDQLQVLAPLFD